MSENGKAVKIIWRTHGGGGEYALYTWSLALTFIPGANCDNADIPPQTLQETLKCICSTGQRRKQLLACHIQCAEFYVLWLIPQNRQLGHLGQSWRGSEERLKTEDRNTGGGSMTRNCASQNPTAKEAPHMFCPSHQDFYFMLSSINSFSGGIHGAPPPPTKKGRQQKKQFFLMEEFITIDEVISNK